MCSGNGRQARYPETGASFVELNQFDGQIQAYFDGTTGGNYYSHKQLADGVNYLRQLHSHLSDAEFEEMIQQVRLALSAFEQVGKIN